MTLKIVTLLVAVLCIEQCWSAENCDVEERNDCGYWGVDEKGCTARECCWIPKDNEPWCYQSSLVSSGSCRPDLDKNDCGYFGINEYDCLQRGCCFQAVEGSSYCFQKSSAPSACVDVDVKDKIDCGKIGINEEVCSAKGCCWKEEENEPWCFYKSAAPTYDGRRPLVRKPYYRARGRFNRFQ